VLRLLYYARIVWEVIQAFGADKCSFLAAGLCYFVFFSIFPLLLLLVSVAGYFLTAEQAMQQAVQLTQQVFPQQQTFLLEVLQGVMEHRDKASLFGVAALVWSAKNIFLSLGQALNIIWKVPTDRGPLLENVLAIGLSFSVGLIIFLTSVSYAILLALLNFRFPVLGLSPSEVPGIVFLIVNILPVTLVALVLGALYIVLPNRTMTVQQVLPGAIVASLLWEALRRVFGYYLEHMSRFDAVYGSISGIVGFLLWIFVSASVFLLGAEVAWVLNEHRERVAYHEAAIEPKRPLNDRRA
jgi:YihY family inner membrane protein